MLFTSEGDIEIEFCNITQTMVNNALKIRRNKKKYTKYEQVHTEIPKVDNWNR